MLDWLVLISVLSLSNAFQSYFNQLHREDISFHLTQFVHFFLLKKLLNKNVNQCHWGSHRFWNFLILLTSALSWINRIPPTQFLQRDRIYVGYLKYDLVSKIKNHLYLTTEVIKSCTINQFKSWTGTYRRTQSPIDCVRTTVSPYCIAFTACYFVEFYADTLKHWNVRTRTSPYCTPFSETYFVELHFRKALSTKNPTFSDVVK